MRRRKWKKQPDIRYNLEEFRIFMGPLAYKYNDTELKQLQKEMRDWAEFLVDLYEIKHGLRDPEDSDFGSNPEKD